jgi:pyridoxal phosphate enzyme (YggS family)
MTDDAARIAENVADVRRRIADSAARSGRAADAVTLVAVTKYVSADVARLLVESGCRDLGESRPQLLWEKAATLGTVPIFASAKMGLSPLPESLRWHLIGHLQRNKVRRTLPLLAMLHSVDSQRLLAAIDEERLSPLPILLEVNISHETAKHGFAPDEIAPFLARAAEYQHVSIRGLMGMASLEGGIDVARREFAALRELRDRLRAACPTGVTLDELSMGMSGDFEAAIEEGATIVRIGSALFEGVQ